MKTPNNPAAEAIDKLTAQNAELAHLKEQTEIGNRDYCNRLDSEIASNQSIIEMLTPTAEWVDGVDGVDAVDAPTA